MRIYLDDDDEGRPTPEGYERAHNLAELREILEKQPKEAIEEMSFDNDLGEGEKEGWEIMQWLAREHQERYPKKTRVHSANGPAAERMEGFDKNFRKHVLRERFEKDEEMRYRRV